MTEKAVGIQAESFIHCGAAEDNQQHLPEEAPENGKTEFKRQITGGR